MLWTVVLMAGAFLAGTAAHEATHWATAKLLGADVERVSLVPPNPRVVYVTNEPATDIWVRGSTLILAAPVLVGALVVGMSLPLRWRLAVLVAAVGYMPRSQSDWLALTDAWGVWM